MPEEDQKGYLGNGIVSTRVGFWTATINVIQGIQAWIRNYAKEARKLAEQKTNSSYKDELLLVAERLDWISGKPSADFRRRTAALLDMPHRGN